MNKTEHLLTCLAEEAAEIQQAACKALRFGLDDGHPERTTTNAQDIAKEFIEIVAVVQLLEAEGAIEKLGNIEAIKEKKAKILHYMDYAKKRGTLQVPSTGGNDIQGFMELSESLR